MRQATIDSRILKTVRLRRACDLDDLLTSCPGVSWYDLFLHVDVLSREGRLRVTSGDWGVYRITIGRKKRKQNGPST